MTIKVYFLKHGNKNMIHKKVIEKKRWLHKNDFIRNMMSKKWLLKTCFENHDFRNMVLKVWPLFQKHEYKKTWLQRHKYKSIISKTWFQKHDYKNMIIKIWFQNMIVKTWL